MLNHSFKLFFCNKFEFGGSCWDITVGFLSSGGHSNCRTVSCQPQNCLRFTGEKLAFVVRISAMVVGF